MKKLAFIAALILLSFFMFTGCQSIQQNQAGAAEAGEKYYKSLADLEETVVRLDGAGADREGLAQARQQAEALAGSSDDPAFDAILAALSGRLFLMEGKISDARQEYGKSEELLPMNLPSQILNIRLERDLPRRLSLAEHGIETSSSSGELLIEQGRVLFDLNRFAESAAAFDAAFALLKKKPYYEESYRVFRDKAVELAALEQNNAGGTAAAGQGEITWKDAIDITKNETDLLKFITSGRDIPAEAVFAQLLDRSFIPLTQDAAANEWPFTKPSVRETVRRSGAAWFLWHLLAENSGNRGLLTMYSSRYANTPNARSPIPDVGIWSPFIDSVLGCVVSDIMSLPDGSNFMPNGTVKGADFLSMLKKLSP